MQEEPYTKLSIIVLGETGSGKSLFCKLFSNMQDFISKRATSSVTTDIISKTFRNDEKKVEIQLIDTPGSNDSRGHEQNEINLETIQRFLKEQKQRINCIVIVMDSKLERLKDSIRTSIKNICSIFPLPDFWKHVIIFWTHWEFRYPEDEMNQKDYIEHEILDDFKELSNKISEEQNSINPIENNLHMLFNEYNEETRDQERIRRNKENSKRNFDAIIDLAKNMKPIYKDILQTDNKLELQQPFDGVLIGNYRQFKYKKLLIRKFRDFGDEIIEKPETLATFIVQEIETDWILCPEESNEELKKYRRYKKRVFIDQNGAEFQPGDDINIPKEESFKEKTLKKKNTANTC